MAVVGITVLTLGTIAGMTLLRGLVLQVIWTWFVAETFNVTTLTLAQAIGLSLVVSFLTHQYTPNTDTRPYTERWVEATTAGLLLCGFAYLFAAIAHSFA